MIRTRRFYSIAQETDFFFIPLTYVYIDGIGNSPSVLRPAAFCCRNSTKEKNTLQHHYIHTRMHKGQNSERRERFLRVAWAVCKRIAL